MDDSKLPTRDKFRPINIVREVIRIDNRLNLWGRTWAPTNIHPICLIPRPTLPTSAAVT